ncbi:hypothetical protein [Clostridium sp. DL1XJH146]
MDMYKDKTKKNNLIILLIRWWSVGAVYFFIGWGTKLGSYNSSIDFVIMLGIVIGLFNSLIINPIIKMLYNVGSKKSYLESSVWEKIWSRLKEVALAILIVYLVTLVYYVINIGAISLLNLSKETVVLPGEPIIFALFYVLIYQLFAYINKKIRSRRNVK